MKAQIQFLIFFLLLPYFSIGQTITSVEPDSATQCQKLDIYISGNGLQFMQGSSTVWLEQGSQTIYSTSSTVLNSNEIVGEFFFNPSHSVGSYDVVAWDGGGSGASTMEDGFWLMAVANIPELSNSLPDTVNNGENVSFTITGDFTHFDVPGVDNYVRFLSGNGGELVADNVSIVHSEELTASFFIGYTNPAGDYDLHITNKLDGHMILEDAMHIKMGTTNPEIVSVEPNSAYQGDQLSVVVTGRNTTFEQGSSTLKFIKEMGSITPESRTVLNDTVIVGNFIFNFNDEPGVYDVRVGNDYWGDVILIDGFELLASAGSPEILWSDPASANMGSRTVITIKAHNTNYNDSDNMPSVSLYYMYEELYPQRTTVVDSVTIEAEFVFSYANRTEPKKLIVNSPFEGTLILENAFQLIEQVPDATISGVDPDSAYLDDVITVNITGDGIIFMPGTSQIKLVQDNFTIDATLENIINDTSITGEFDFLNSFPLGLYDVVVNNSWAWPEMTLEDGFTLSLFDFVDENSGFSLLTIYPNPCHDFLNVVCNVKMTGTISLTIYDIMGVKVQETEHSYLENEFQVYVKDAKPGKYFLKITDGDRTEVKQFIVN